MHKKIFNRIKEGGGGGGPKEYTQLYQLFWKYVKKYWWSCIIWTFYICLREVKCTEVKIKFIFIQIKTFAEVN